MANPEYRINGQPLPIDESSFRVAYAKWDNMSFWILTAQERGGSEPYLLTGYATMLLVNDFMLGAVPNFDFLARMTHARLPGVVGLSMGGHDADEVQKVLEKHAKANPDGFDEKEWLVGLAGRLHTAANSQTISIDEDELGIFRKLSRTDHRLLPPPRPRY